MFFHFYIIRVRQDFIKELACSRTKRSSILWCISCSSLFKFGEKTFLLLAAFRMWVASWSVWLLLKFISTLIALISSDIRRHTVLVGLIEGYFRRVVGLPIRVAKVTAPSSRSNPLFWRIADAIFSSDLDPSPLKPWIMSSIFLSLTLFLRWWGRPRPIF